MTRTSDRMALLRARRKHGLRCVSIEVRDAEVLELVRRGLMAEAGSKDSSNLMVLPDAGERRPRFMPPVKSSAGIGRAYPARLGAADRGG